jgi:membrane-bound lytic murein transglycosylase F
MRRFGKRVAWVWVASLWVACAPSPASAGGPGLSLAPAEKTDYDDYFRKYAKHYFGIGSDWTWFKAQAIAESNLQPQARSGVRAKGVMQLMPATYAELKKKNPDLGVIDEPRWNIAAGIQYDLQMWDRHAELTSDDERRRFMFGSYNAGLATILRARRVAREAGHADQKWQGIVTVAPQVPQWRHEETLRYVTRIEDIQRQLARR